MYIAVVYGSTQRSGRSLGDYSAFVASTKESAVRQAIQARQKWESGGSPPYRILVGYLSEEVQLPAQFTLVAMEEEA